MDGLIRIFSDFMITIATVIWFRQRVDIAMDDPIDEIRTVRFYLQLQLAIAAINFLLKFLWWATEEPHNNLMF